MRVLSPEIDLLSQMKEKGYSYVWRVNSPKRLGNPPVHFTSKEFHRLLVKLHQQGYLEKYRKKWVINPKKLSPYIGAPLRVRSLLKIFIAQS